MNVEPYTHPAFSQPDNQDEVLWRYLDLYKFQWLVQQSRLYMPSVRDFPDKFEGTPPGGDVTWWESRIQAAQSQEEREVLVSNRDKIWSFAKLFRQHCYVSCWHMNDGESLQMWAADTQGARAVAIRTTYRKLRQMLPGYVDLGMVRYINYKTDRLPEMPNIFEFLMNKDVEKYSFENEVRAVALIPAANGEAKTHFLSNFFEQSEPPNSKFYAPPVDISSLIDAVVIHRESSVADEAAIRALCEAKHLPPLSESILV